MAHLIPPDYPDGTSPGEALLFEMLREPAVGREWTVLHSLHLPQHVRQIEGEADFVVMMPALGVLCLEVKGHRRADYVDGAWYLGSDAGPDYRGPFRQAEMAARSVKRKIVSALPSASRFVFWSAVVFTHCVPAASASVGDWHRWQLLTCADLERDPLDQLLGAIMRLARDHVSQSVQARWFDATSIRPTAADCGQMRAILRPDVHFLPATSTLRRRRRDEIRRFTEEQLAVIEGLDGINDRALIEGPAGTGKTVLAFEEARRSAATGQATALVCFNHQLAEYLRDEAAQLGLKGVDIATLHAVMQRVAGHVPPAGAAANSAYWSQHLPEAALTALIEGGAPYEFLIVDEVQDLATSNYLDVIDALLCGELSGGRWRMFGDFERQAIYSDDSGAPDVGVGRILHRARNVARFKLRRNCRNTPRVAEYVVRLGGLVPAYSKVMRPDSGPEGTPRTAFYGSDEEQGELLGQALLDLQRLGDIAPEDIVILSPVVDSCASKLARWKSKPVLEPLPIRHAGATSFGTISAFKGLEAPAIVLTDIEEVATPRAQCLFYVGISRATDRLRVLARDGLQAAMAELVTGAGS